MDGLFGGNVTFGMEDMTGATTPVLPFPADVTQLVAGGRYSILGMVWHIEYVTGDERTGRSPDGTTYSTPMVCAYGEVEGTRDADGDPVDIFINQTNFDPKAPVRIMDLRKKDTGDFDEHKLWVGFPMEMDVTQAFGQMYNNAPVVNGGITDLPLEKMRGWVTSPDTLRPAYDRDSEVQSSTISKISEREPVVIPLTNPAPKVLVTKNGSRTSTNVYILSEFCTESWGVVTETILDLLMAASEGDEFMFAISSYGGELDLAARIGSAIRQTAAHVTTVSVGPVASAGCLLWCEGHTRLITRGSYFMQHDASCIIGGKVSHIARQMEATNAYIKTVIFARAIATGLFSKEEVSALVDRSIDIFISAREAAARTKSEII